MNSRYRVTAVPTLLAAALASRFALPGSLLARVQTPESLDALGLETITLVSTPEGITGMPEELEAGYYLVNLSGEPGEGQMTVSASMFKFPEGMTLDTMPAIDPEAMMQPDFIYEGTFAGGREVILPLGETSSQCVVMLTAGDWVVTSSAFELPPMPFVVTGELPTDVSLPTATVELTMGEMYFEITSGEFVAGSNLLSLTSHGGQPHFLIMIAVPPGTTNDDIAAMLSAEMEAESAEGSPEAGPPEGADEGADLPVLIMSDQSLNTTVWTEFEAESGTYALLCFFPDQHTGMPHAMLNMHAVVEIP